VQVHGGDATQPGLTPRKTAKWLISPDATGEEILVRVPLKLSLTDGQIVRPSSMPSRH
jgi:hypothetical protein